MRLNATQRGPTSTANRISAFVISFSRGIVLQEQTLMLQFTKMNGAGNDFVLLDNRDGQLALQREAIARLCDRHRGVGADGVMIVEPAKNGADFRMRYYNADGGEAEMCGNGARCFARFVDRIAGPKENVTFETIAG